MLYLDTNDAEAVAFALAELGRPVLPVLTDAEAFIQVSGASLAEHLASVSSRLRQRFRREMAMFEHSGLRVECRPLASCLDILARLHHELQQRYGQEWDLDRTERSMRRLADAAPAEALLLLAVDETGHAVGFSLSYPWAGTLYVRVTGYEYERLRSACEYFMLTCYEPLRYSAQAGYKRLHLGLESLEAKMIRGAELEPLWSVIVPADHDLPTDRVLAANRSRVARLRTTYAAHRAAFRTPSWQAWQ